MSEMDNLDDMLDRATLRGKDLVSLDDLVSSGELAQLKLEPRECCGLPEGGPDGNYGDLVQGQCSAGHCTVLYCPCGATDASFGPVGCPCQNEVMTDGK